MKYKKLPIGIQTLKKLRQEGCIYVDKTNIAYKLIEQGSYYFLARPRRFGKSLFLDTLSEIFKGSKELFQGLAIYDKWDWNTKYPVIKFDFSEGSNVSEEMILNSIRTKIYENAELLNLELKENKDLSILLSNLIKSANKKYNQQIVILVDEYDKPIIDNISNQDLSINARNILANFYSGIKSCDKFIKFVFITGVSKFSKVNLFSNLNNLKDITLDKKYATITGYTNKDLEESFAEYLSCTNHNMVKKWYNGYNYLGTPVYNPYDILLFFSEDCKFKNYWWNTGNPSFLIEILKHQKCRYYIPELENTVISEEILNTFDVNHIELPALLWQTGYLTFAEEIINKNNFKISYKFKIPNIEIQSSLNSLFLDYLTNLNGEKTKYSLSTSNALDNGDVIALEASLKQLFAAIPYANYANNIIAEYEGYYATVIFTHIASLGYDFTAEDYTNKGRIDLTVKVAEHIYIFEFKVDMKESAIKQIKERKYYEKYISPNNIIHLIGINFSSEEKNITEFKTELVIS